MAEFVMKGLEHQSAVGALSSFEGPLIHALLKQPAWQERFGTPEAPRGPWRYAELDGCMFHVVSPIPEDGGRPMKKGYRVMANFDISLLAVRCRDGKFSPLTKSVPALSALPPCDTDSDPGEVEPTSVSSRLPPAGTPCCCAVPDSAGSLDPLLSSLVPTTWPPGRSS